MKCSHCGQEHPEELINCPSTGKMLKRACTNKDCSYLGEYIWPVEKASCPCCGRTLKDSYNGHEFIDLGLSVKWATCNIGALRPEESGDRFAWGETEPKETYESLNYKFRAPKHSVMLKYNCNPSSIYRDNKLILEPEDDAASVKWGDGWRIPTKDEWEELFDHCYFETKVSHGVMGYRVSGKRTGFRKNWIFLPSYEDYWSSTLFFDYGKTANAVYPSAFPGRQIRSYERYRGLAIRPILASKD